MTTYAGSLIPKKAAEAPNREGKRWFCHHLAKSPSPTVIAFVRIGIVRGEDDNIRPELVNSGEEFAKSNRNMTSFPRNLQTFSKSWQVLRAVQQNHEETDKFGEKVGKNSCEFGKFPEEFADSLRIVTSLEPFLQIRVGA